MDKAFYIELEAGSCSQALVLMGDFNHPHISWRDSTAEHKQPRRYLDSISDNFLTQAIEEPMRRGGHLLYLILTNKEDLLGK